MLNQTKLDKLVESAITKKNIFGAVFCVESNDMSTDLIAASGNIKVNDLYYTASINKIFVSAIILKFVSENKLSLEDQISKYLSDEIMSGLHIHKGHDYSNDITIKHLISQTSGLPCYLTDKSSDDRTVMTELLDGNDQSWSIDDSITRIKSIQPSFPPQDRKARYIDTNHQILSKIIENICGDKIDVSLRKLIVNDLELSNTYVSEEINDSNFAPIYYKSKSHELPKFMSSTGNEIVSNAKDQMKFLKAFFKGHFFPTDILKSLEKWNNVFFPFKYGIGIQRFYLPRWMTPFKAVPKIIGHCGSIGSVAFYVPEKEIFITGTVNQLAKPNVAFQIMLKIINMVK